MPLEIITCPEWKARPSRTPVVLLSEPATRVIFHHTAGHHAEIQNPKDESRAESIRYARDIQSFHMNGRGWIDSGHNFLVCRNGVVLQGRWKTVSQIEAGGMVVSAHCPGQNDQIGVEHEHAGREVMPAVQREASARLMAWIARHYGRRYPLPAYPHSKFVSTACPGSLVTQIPRIMARAAYLLDEGDL